MILLGDEAQVEARFGPIEDNANLDARRVHGLHRTFHVLRKSFWMHMMELLGDVGQVESCFGPFGHSVCVGAR
jgi:site-specific recombinase XerC